VTVPTVLQGFCTHCGYRSAILTAGYGAVFVDHPVAESQSEIAGAAIFVDCPGEFSEVNDPRFVILSHPGEIEILAGTGYSWGDLFWQGRYVAVTNVVCRQCGNIFARRRLAVPFWFGCVMTGIMAPLILIAVGLTVGRSTHRPLVAGLAAGAAYALVWLLYEAVCRIYLYARFRERAAALAAEISCPNCNARDSRGVEGAKRICCPSCKKKSVSFQMVGMS